MKYNSAWPALVFMAAVATIVHADQGYRDFHPLALDTRTAAPPTMQGYVRDAFNQRAIEYAQVRLEGTDGYVETDTADASGFFVFANLDLIRFPGGSASLMVDHIGYWSSTQAGVSVTNTAEVALQSKTVVLLHGFAGSYQGTWGGNGGPFPSALSDTAGLRVVGVDVGGFPNNIKPVSFALEAFRSALEAECHSRGIQSYDMVGHSMGGLVGRSYAAKAYGKNRIRKLVTLGTPHHGANLANVMMSWGSAGRTLLAQLICKISAGLYCPNPADLGIETALDDLRIGSAFLNTLNYGVGENSDRFDPCRDSFNEATDYKNTEIYSIAGTQPGGEYWLTVPFLGCRGGLWKWAESDGIVLRPRALYHGGEMCTDEGLGCPGAHHKIGSESLTSSHCLARAVGNLLVSNVFQCSAQTPTNEKDGQGGFIPSQLPLIEAMVSPGATRVDSTLISAIGLADFLCVSTADSLIYTLRSPSGRVIDPAECELDPDLEYIRDSHTAYYSIRNPEAGLWQHQIVCPGSTEPELITIHTVFDGALVLVAGSSTGIDPEGEFVLKAEFTNSGLSIPTGTVTALVTRPDATTEPVELFDDGIGEDETAGDGLYAATYPAGGQAGTYGFAFLGDSYPGNPQSELREALHVATASRLPDPAVAEPGLVVTESLVPIGGLVSMSAAFTNLGTATADSVLITITNVAYNVALAETLLAQMAPGQTVTLQAEWLGVAEGMFALRAGIDMVGEQLESSAANNGSEVQVTVFVPGGASGVPGDGDDGNPDGAPTLGTGGSLLYSGFPNPLGSGSAHIRFRVPGSGQMTELAVFDIRGRRVRTIGSEVMSAGDHEWIWDGSDNAGRQVASGVYFYRLQVVDEVQVRKVVVVR